MCPALVCSCIQVCLIDWKGRAPGRRARPSLPDVYWSPGSPGFSFIGNQAGRPVQHAPTLTLKQLNFLMQFSPQPGSFRNWSKVILDPDFSLTAWVVSKCPHWGQRPHTEATIPKRGGGVCGSLLALMWEGGGISWAHKEEEGAPGYVRGGGEIQVKCRVGGLLPYWLIRARPKLPSWLIRVRPKLPRRIDLGAPIVALLIDLGAPLAGRFGDFFFFFRARSWGLIDSFRSR